MFINFSKNVWKYNFSRQMTQEKDGNIQRRYFKTTNIKIIKESKHDKTASFNMAHGKNKNIINGVLER